LTGARRTSPDDGSIHLPLVGSYFTSTHAPGGATMSAVKLPSAAAVVKTSLALLGLATYTGKAPGIAPAAPTTCV